MEKLRSQGVQRISAKIFGKGSSRGEFEVLPRKIRTRKAKKIESPDDVRCCVPRLVPGGTPASTATVITLIVQPGRRITLIYDARDLERFGQFQSHQYPRCPLSGDPAGGIEISTAPRERFEPGKL